MKTIFIITILLQSLVFSQSLLEKQRQFADKLFDSGDYFDAITEYKRLIFFDKADKYKEYSYVRIGKAYKKGAFLDNAIKYFNKAKEYSENEFKKDRINLEILKCSILKKDFNEAAKIIENISQRNNVSPDTIKYWKSWMLMFQGKWDEAAKLLNALDNCNDLLNLCLEIENKKYSVQFAKVISYILPGAGQIYTGEYISGIMSFAWNLFLAERTVTAIIDDRIFDGLVISNLLWFRFYRGNFQNAEKFAIRKNKIFDNEGLRFLQENYRGLKP